MKILNTIGSGAAETAVKALVAVALVGVAAVAAKGILNKLMGK